MLDLLLADVTAGPLAEVCILECPLVNNVIYNSLYITSNSTFCDSILSGHCHMAGILGVKPVSQEFPGNCQDTCLNQKKTFFLMNL